MSTRSDLDAGRGSQGRYADIMLVALGGALGTMLRFVISLVIPQIGGLPIGIFVINICGAFALGMLLESFGARGHETPGRRKLRMLFGTGLLGGFTTYSALAADTAALLIAGRLAIALVYALGTVICGVGAALLGIALARLFVPRERGTSS